MSSFHCRPQQVHTAGTHAIFIGIVETAASHDAAPLIYTGHNYGPNDITPLSGFSAMTPAHREMPAGAR